ncbi:MAG: AAA family ATPase [Planctomycetaceae bacterium]|jgi:AAA15 family ATPase/GTPase|nr:AAA family ATPase [Planctomycetaceae bacterium]
MKIKSIYVNNFKSLVNFKIDLADFNCLVGLNGSGKSTFLQFVSFLSQLMKGNMKGWLNRRGWEFTDCLSQMKTDFNIEFRVDFVEDDNLCGSWEGTYQSILLYCVKEKISYNGVTIIVENIDDNTRTFRLTENNVSLLESNIIFQYKGSILSVLKHPIISEKFDTLKSFISGIEMCDLLSPDMLHQGSKVESAESIGLKGENLAAFLWKIGEEKCNKIVQKLKPFYPQLEKIEIQDCNYVKPLIGNIKKELFITESYKKQQSDTVVNLVLANHINDGLLRLIAFLAQLETKSQSLLFDEIENGINTELIDFLMKQLIENDKQIIVTTHSPMILNFIDDDIARKGVHYFYKTQEGFTQSFPFFSISRIDKKLNVMGPGEAFVDTDLINLIDEINVVKNKEQPPRDKSIA